MLNPEILINPELSHLCFATQFTLACINIRLEDTVSTRYISFMLWIFHLPQQSILEPFFSSEYGFCLCWCFMSQSTNFQSCWDKFLGWTSTKHCKQWINCHAQGHNTLTPARLKLVAFDSQSNNLPTESLCSRVLQNLVSFLFHCLLLLPLFLGVLCLVLVFWCSTLCPF